MKPSYRQGFSTQNLNPHSPEPSSTMLSDSKSSTNLNCNEEITKRFRETAYYPKSTKANYQFLRYTVNGTKNNKDDLGPQPPSPSKFSILRKLTQEVPSLTEPKEPHSMGWKSHNFRPLQKKHYNPQKKQEIEQKVSAPGNWPLQKKSKPDDKLQGEKAPISKQPKQFLQKMTFTPKYSKNVGPQTKSALKFTPSFSTSDLTKIDLASSASTSISSRFRRRSSLQMKDFQKMKFLGQGKFGQVFLVQHNKTSTLYGLKQIKKADIIKNDMMGQFIMEIKLQMFLSHPNILKLYGVFDDAQNIYLLLEYMEQGTLYAHLKKKKTFKQEQASRKLRDVLEGIGYLHSQQVAHRDIKPQNIVISYDVCKIGDFGWAAVCEDRRKTLCGTIDYASPELLEGKQYGTAIDLWCVGVLCYELMVGKAPFYHISRKETMRKIIKANISDLHIPSSLPAEATQFIQKMLKKSPQERMSAQQALSHPLITRYNEQQMEELRCLKRRK